MMDRNQVQLKDRVFLKIEKKSLKKNAAIFMKPLDIDQVRLKTVERFCF
jgi:hypothetical protein